MIKSISFCAVWLCLLLMNSAFATIHYTYVGDPVYSTTPVFYDLDLDGDNDFHFTAVDIGPSTGSVKFFVNCTKTSSQYAAEGTNDTLPKAYTEGAGFGTHHWQNTPGLLASPTIGYFNDTEKYLIVKFSDGNNNTYHGWFYLVKNGWYLTVDAYAYSDVPDQIIKAGETEPTGIADVPPAIFQIAKLTKHQIAFRNCDAFDQVNVYSSDGKMLAEISQPVAQNPYHLAFANGIVLVAFSKKGRVLHSEKYFIRQEE